MSSSRAAARLVRKFYEDIWNSGDRSAVDRLLTPDLEFRGSLGPTMTGSAAFWAYVTDLRRALAGYRCEVVELICESGRAAARMKFTGKHVGPLLGIPPTGRQISWSGAAFFGIGGGRIRSVWVLGDLESLRKQLEGERRGSDLNRLVEGHLAAEVAGDADAAVASLADDVQHHVFGELPTVGRSAVREFYVRLFSQLSIRRIEPRRRYLGHAFVVDDSTVFAELRRGGSRTWRQIHLFEVSGGLITKEVAWRLPEDYLDKPVNSALHSLRARGPVEISPENVLAVFMARLHEGDAEAAAGLYAPDAIWVQPDGEARGLQAIQGAIQQLMRLSPTMLGSPLNVMSTGDQALVFNSWSLSGTRQNGDSVQASGVSLVVMRKLEQGAWQILVDDPWGGADDAQA